MAGGDRLRFAGPARRWVEAFPVGNGRLGAMVHGGVHDARVQVNDATAWSGRPGGPAAALADLSARGVGPGTLARLREAVAQGRYDEAASLAQDLQGPYAQAYQPFVDLRVDVTRHDESVGDGLRYGGRALDLRDGVVTEHLEVPDGPGRLDVRWYASAPDSCLHARWRATGTRFGLTLRLVPAHPAPDAVAEYVAGGAVPGGAAVLVELPFDVPPGHEPDLPDRTPRGDEPSLVGAAVLRVATDGRVTWSHDRAVVVGATWAEAVLATATTSRWPHPGPLRTVPQARADASARADAALPADPAAGDAAERRHVADHRALADATRLSFGAPVDLLLPDALDRAAGTPLAHRAQAAFAFGRYALMASSRPGAPPATLQGVWVDEHRPPWSSAYTLNINLQMAYWPAEPTGLGACVAPLVDLVRLVAANGTAVARELYGCDGWVAHHNSDVWGWALPVGRGHGDPAWAAWWMGGVWLCRHLWDRYAYSLDEDVLRDVWPVLRGAAAFALDWLVPDGAGALVPSPSSSPENERLVDGRPVALCAGSTMDVALVRDLLTHCLEAVDVLALDEPLAPRWADALARLPRPSVGPDGLLREWPDDAPARDPHHRHLSHLVGIFPLDELLGDAARSPREHPSDPTVPGVGRPVAEAARASLDARGPGSTGWSMAWKAALRARLGDGPGFEEVLADALVLSHEDGPQAGGLLPNLFSTHPPFQLDGNLGLVAAVAEALVSATRTRVRVLPALPRSWPDGEVVGIRAVGALVVDVRWSAGRLVEVVLHAARDEEREVVHEGTVRRVRLRAGCATRLGAGLVDRAD
ncbi:glycosyl hydrolase family 95 catalytic domain-containing protein [Cellulomonas palmilytica]|uniref:glycosyl hydrolase family 95 catalytic domain-containing protein n=1 Tax=Cellulomonas palmilytica TaxID=2608402 RepID=UPI001F46F44F|nr:glycoside hydrolase N-terminal domain-containing protein [Cellulomonas palmilytica]UJP41317.1 glycoside hydrolase N-terminal domain-containing protein [Cellulomonas palmilytica]